MAKKNLTNRRAQKRKEKLYPTSHRGVERKAENVWDSAESPFHHYAAMGMFVFPLKDLEPHEGLLPPVPDELMEMGPPILWYMTRIGRAFPEELTEWAKTPGVGVGIATGIASRKRPFDLFALELIGPDAVAWADEHEWATSWRAAFSPTWQYIFFDAEDHTLPTTMDVFRAEEDQQGRKVNLLAHHGTVPMPPTPHPTGGEPLRWINGGTPDGPRPLPLPPLLHLELYTGIQQRAIENGTATVAELTGSLGYMHNLLMRAMVRGTTQGVKAKLNKLRPKQWFNKKH